MADDAGREAAIEQARQLISAGMIAELITDIRQMASAILAFAERQDETEKQVKELHSLRRRNGAFAVAALILSVALAGAVTALALVVWSQGHKLTTIAETNRTNGQVLVDCTTPTPTSTTSSVPRHKCYEDSRAATGDAVAAIVDASVDAAVCARMETTEQAIRACVAARLTTTTTTQP